jgi:hypothetical protein
MNKANPWLYLMSKYTGRELDSLQENQDAWLALNAKGYWVYSPICESHNIEERRKEIYDFYCEKCDRIFGICIADFPQDREYCPQCRSVIIRKNDYKEPDYVARDLALIKSWLVPEPICGAEEQGYNRYSIFHDGCIGCKFVEDPIDEYHCSTCGLLKWKQPKVVGVVLPSSIIKCSHPNFCNYPELPLIIINNERYHWDSKGAKAEYDFMKAHHILVISLETALTIPSDRWEEYGI